jgi:hypothetical protein
MLMKTTKNNNKMQKFRNIKAIIMLCAIWAFI